nr:uncharacterized protein LOC123759413 isoform X7 [Procambarus clarkii]
MIREHKIWSNSTGAEDEHSRVDQLVGQLPTSTGAEDEHSRVDQLVSQLPTSTGAEDEHSRVDQLVSQLPTSTGAEDEHSRVDQLVSQLPTSTGAEDEHSRVDQLVCQLPTSTGAEDEHSRVDQLVCQLPTSTGAEDEDEHSRIDQLVSQLPTSTAAEDEHSRVDQLVCQLSTSTGAEDEHSRVEQLICQESSVENVSVKSEDGYEEDVEDSEEDVISDSEVVVSASMQFPLSNKSEHEEKASSEPQPLEKEQASSRDSRVPLESSTGVTVSVQSQLSQSPTGEESPSGCESDVEDNDEDEIKEEHSVSGANSQVVAVSRIPSSVQLPETVTRLDTSYGSSVFLVGTAHFSKESQADVADTIRRVKPDIVVVELCKARTAILQLDEETILQESRSLDFKKMQMIIRQHGKIQGILYLLLLSVSAHITKQLGMAPGGEFRTAFAEARQSAPGCIIQLGDRPIQVTLSRALASLSLWHKVKLTWHILTSKEPISKEEVEKCKQRDFIEEMLAEMTGQFPAISEVFVKERDLYLCRSLQAAAQPVPNPLSPSGISPRVVVGVVGIGHVPGIVEHWGKVTDADIIPIMRIPPTSLSSKILKITFKMSMYGLVGYGVYKCLPSSAKSTIHASLQSAITSVSSVLPKWQK